MLEQFAFAYLAGMILVIALEIGAVLKARRMTRAATKPVRPAAAAAFRSVNTVSNSVVPAANETEPVLMQAAG